MALERIPEIAEEEQRALFGPLDRHLRAVRERWGVRISARRGTLLLEGPEDDVVQEVAGRVRRALEAVRRRPDLPDRELERLLLAAPSGAEAPPPAAPLPRGGEERGPGPARPGPGGPRPPAPGRAPTSPRSSSAGPHPVATRAVPPGPSAQPRPLTPNQEVYVHAIRAHDVVFAVGPAGTGKTYLAVAEAVASLRSGATRKIILTRPAVEAGERLGFLPGDFQAKINPYLRPLYDALEELLPFGEVRRYLDQDVIEIVPLAYMRGRTLKGAFIILDEGQNTTPAQMKMFLTRMGGGSKVVVNGDVTQVDLPEGAASGLVHAIGVLEAVKGLSVVRFGAEDILRHPLVQRIVDAYERVRPRAEGEGGSERAP